MKIPFQKHTVWKALLLVVLLTTIAVIPAGGQVPTWEELGEVAPMAPTGPVVVRLYVDDQEHLNAVAGYLDIWEVHKEDRYVVAQIGPAQFQWLADLGYEMEIDAARTSQLVGPLAPLDPRFYYFDTDVPNSNDRYIVDFLQTTNAAHPGLTELIDIGDAWLSDHGGIHRDILVLRITNEAPEFGPIEDKPPFFLFATIHAREVAVSELAIRYIKYLLDGFDGEGGYGVNADATWLVDHNVVYVLVMQNPDGHVVNEQNTSANRRKNMDNDDGCSTPSSWGVDLNRNHSFFWGCCGGSSGYACDDTYRGPSAGSEPETQAFQTYFATVFEDQNGPNGDNQVAPAAPDDAAGIFISLHSYSDLVLWPWGFEDPLIPPPPNYDQLTTIGRKLAAFNGYDPMGTIWYDVDGATDDWTYGKLGVASYTFEVGTDSGGACSGFFPAYGCIDGIDGMPRDFWAENKPAFLYAHKIARTPYMTAYGPDTDVVTVAPTSTIPLGQVALAATLADHRYDDDPLQPITGAEYFIDVPGEDGAGTPMTVSDGSWGGVAEDVEAMVDVSGLSLGRHLVLVHGQNDDGDWGPFTAAFLDIVDPTSAPVIEGYVREYGTLAPLAGTVVAGAFSTLSDPATGYYSMTVISGAYDMTAIAAGHALTVAGGVEAFHYQTVQQDFVLYPICTLLADDVESGNTGWTADAPWAITDEAAHSPSHSWTDSPGGAYSPTIEVALTSPVLDFTGLADVTLNFWHSYDLESNWDKARIQYSTDGGSNWNNSVYYTGRDHTTWSSETVSLPALDGESNARLRFLLDPDHAMQFDGWHIDDITVAASGPSCPQTTAPVAAFSSNSPVTLGTPVQFTNESTGSLPMAFAWDFGDGAGMSTLSDPIYTYANTGTFTVTLVITNAAGSDDVSHPVIVNAAPVSPTYGVTLSPTTAAESAAPGSAAAYTVTLHNTGTVADTFDLTTSGAEIWTTAVDPTQVTLAAGTLVQITVTVTLPADALGNDVATITATSQGDNAISASATLTTTALPTYRVYLPILQRHE